MTHGSNDLHFFYDAQNRPAIVAYNGAKYAYIYNLQGDVLGLIDSNGTEVVKYTYDAWGKVLSTTGSLAPTLGIVQPFRYRGYVYDVETGLYYLRSRYYNSVWGRFINADSLIKSSLFMYCGNNPVVNMDHSGKSYLWDDEEEISFEDILDPSNDSSIPVLNETITSGMRKYLINAGDYTYCKRGRQENALDCVAAVNDADDTNYGSMVDKIWDQFRNNCTEWGVITDFDALQPGDLVFSLKLPRGMERQGYIGKLKKMKWFQLAELKKPHIGRVVTIDFKNTNNAKNAIYQSCSVRLSPIDWDAYFYNDLGPNITAPTDHYGNSNWYLYIRP